MTTLACTRTGSGRPLVLLHGLGSLRQIWEPVVPALAEHFDVLAIDLPGFGESPAMPPGVEPSPAALADAVAELLDELGVGPAHLVGNSLGGWVALELAARRSTASVTLLSPAGLWAGSRTPLYCRVSLRATRWGSEHAGGILSRVVATRLGRVLVLGQTSGRPTLVTPAEARVGIHGMGTCVGFPATLRATSNIRYTATGPITAPVTVAFGSRDRLLLPHQSRNLAELPPQTVVGRLPLVGHAPAAVDAPAVVALIETSTARAHDSAGTSAGAGIGGVRLLLG